jgi:site-specific DNA recombinase
MGGWVPLGYDADGRTLTINEAEAETVRQLFRLYLDLGTVAAVEDGAKRRGLITKRYVTRNGRHTGGLPFSRGHLYKILSNPLYVGEIAHRDRRYGGQHPAITDPATWNAVQAQLKSHTRERQVRSRAKEPALLADLLFDQHGARFTSTHAVKHGKRYRYYVAAANGGANGSTRRLPAHDVEALVTGELAAFLSDQQRLAQALDPWRPSPDHLQGAFHVAEVVSDQLIGPSVARRQAMVQAVTRIEASETGLAIQLRPEGLLAADLVAVSRQADWLSIHVPAALERRGSEIKLVVPGAGAGSSADPALIKVIARGHMWFEELATGRASTIAEIAGRENVTDRYVSSLLKLAFLPPRLVDACLAGETRELSAMSLVGADGVPMLWKAAHSRN